MTFAQWCDTVGGIDKAAGILGKNNIYATKAWYHKTRCPRLKEAQNMIRCSNGLLDFNGIYGAYE